MYLCNGLPFLLLLALYILPSLAINTRIEEPHGPLLLREIAHHLVFTTGALCLLGVDVVE